MQRHQLSHHLISGVAEFAAASCLVVAVGAFPSCRAGGVVEASQGGAGVGGRQDGAAEAVPPFRDGAAEASHLDLREGHLGAADASYAAAGDAYAGAEAC